MSILNPWGALRRERLNAAALSADLIESRGRAHHALVEALSYRGALLRIKSAATSVNTPNGTTRKILKIAEQAVGA